MKDARTELVDLEDMSDREIELQEELDDLHARLSRTGHLPQIGAPSGGDS